MLDRQQRLWELCSAKHTIWRWRRQQCVWCSSTARRECVWSRSTAASGKCIWGWCRGFWGFVWGRSIWRPQTAFTTEQQCWIDVEHAKIDIRTCCAGSVPEQAVRDTAIVFLKCTVAMHDCIGLRDNDILACSDGKSGVHHAACTRHGCLQHAMALQCSLIKAKSIVATTGMWWWSHVCALLAQKVCLQPSRHFRLTIVHKPGKSRSIENDLQSTSIAATCPTICCLRFACVLVDRD